MINRLLLCALLSAAASQPAHAGTAPPPAQQKPAAATQSVQAPMAFPVAEYATPIQRATPPVTEAERIKAKGQPCPTPDYPYGAKQRKEEGTTRIRALVEPDGFLSNLKVIESSGSAELDQAALSTIGGCWFPPAKHGLSEYMETSYTWKL